LGQFVHARFEIEPQVPGEGWRLPRLQLGIPQKDLAAMGAAKVWQGPSCSIADEAAIFTEASGGSQLMHMGI